eukprot:CAMPEP_0170458100 /NCGR_PEP_ID=MMETSP0123-20130129/5174_1 /TAXON_ID=182087 /ORGANISM="Favella ehrenbergii, Strain Fehren 1" /LENGTH=46 /DNA_ID= /DNA_START= /DNA_END= /DNA_ORIENTATION=
MLTILSLQVMETVVVDENMEHFRVKLLSTCGAQDDVVLAEIFSFGL